MTGDDDVQISEVTKCEVVSILLNETAWLTYTIMDEAQQLLKSMSETKGFQSVAVGRTTQFEIQNNEFIQILHCDSGH